MMADTILEFNGFCVGLGGRPVLTDVSLKAAKGEYVSILGQNGAGKTTLLRAALGMYPEGKGRVMLKGRPIGAYTRRELARVISYVPQNVEITFPMSVREFVLLGRFAHLGFLQSPGRSDQEAARRALELTEALGFADRSFSSLSGGEKQRVLIAAALTQEPEILLLDEVTHFLDPRYEDEIQSLLGELNKREGVTVFSVTHDINRAALNSTRVVALKSGRIVFNNGPREFADNRVLMEVYDKQFIFVAHPQRSVQLVVPDL